MRVRLIWRQTVVSPKLLNHPVFTLPAWQLEGSQTLLWFFICTQFRWFGAQALLCMCVHMYLYIYLVSSVSLIAFLLSFSVQLFQILRFISIHLSYFSSICGFPLSLSLLCLLKLSTSSCLFITPTPFFCLLYHLLLLSLDS